MFWDTALKILWHMICIGTNPVQVQFHLAQYFIWAQFYLSLLPQVRFTVTAMVCADFSLQWRHNEHDGVSNHQHHHCLLNRLFKAQIKENTKAPRQWPLCEEIHRCPVNSPHKGPVTRKMFPFDDVIMLDLHMHEIDTWKLLYTFRRSRDIWKSCFTRIQWITMTYFRFLAQANVTSQTCNNPGKRAYIVSDSLRLLLLKKIKISTSLNKSKPHTQCNIHVIFQFGVRIKASHAHRTMQYSDDILIWKYFIIEIWRKHQWAWICVWKHIMTSSNGNIFCVTGPLCGEFTGHQWIPLTKASDAELWCFLWSVPE